MTSFTIGDKVVLIKRENALFHVMDTKFSITANELGWTEEIINIIPTIYGYSLLEISGMLYNPKCFQLKQTWKKRLRQ